MLPVILFLIILTEGTSGVNIISRHAWGARPSKTNQMLAVNPPSHVVIHHSGAANHKCSSIDECKATVKKIQNYHMDSKKWKDIGYNFLVGDDGNAYEGRGWSKWGSHAPSFNKKSIGICMMGDFTNKAPSQQQIETAKDLIQFGVNSNLIARDYKLIGHRQDTSANTACPGNKLFDEIQQWPHFTRNL